MFPMIVLAVALLRRPVVQPTLPVTATVSTWEWVYIMNPGVGSGMTCGIQFGNTVELIGRAGTRVLVRYQGSETPGTPCDGGEIFFLSIREYRTMTARYTAEMARRAQQNAEIKELLANRVTMPREQLVPEWTWADIVGTGTYGETCGTNPGAKVYEIATTDDGRVLVRYDSNGTGTAGTPCDGGEIFFVVEADFVSMTDRHQGVAHQEENEADTVDRLLREEWLQKLKRLLP